MRGPRNLEAKQRKVEAFARDHNGGKAQCSTHPRLSEMTTAKALAVLKAHHRIAVSRPWFCKIVDAMRPRVKRRNARGPDAMNALVRRDRSNVRMRARYRATMANPRKHKAYRERKNKEVAARRSGDPG